MIWIALVVAVVSVAALGYALCAAAQAGDADLESCVQQPARPPASVDESLERLGDGLERLLVLATGLLDVTVVAIERGDGVWSCRAAERRVRRHAPGATPAALIPRAQAQASAPMGTDGAPRGRLTVVSNDPDRRFETRDLSLLALLAEAAGAALDAPQAPREALAVIATQIDVLAGELSAGRDDLRWRGGDFVALTAAVGRRLGLSGVEQAELELAARLLDIGLLRVPTDVLDRPGPLNAAERQLVRRHTTWGAEALLRVPGLAAVAVIVLTHHERWDGAGYPFGLPGERIPIAARVLSACDTWWAITSQRPYAEAMEPETAAVELLSAWQRQLDPDAVDAVLAEVAGVTLVA